MTATDVVCQDNAMPVDSHAKRHYDAIILRYRPVLRAANILTGRINNALTSKFPVMEYKYQDCYKIRNQRNIREKLENFAIFYEKFKFLLAL